MYNVCGGRTERLLALINDELLMIQIDRLGTNYSLTLSFWILKGEQVRHKYREFAHLNSEVNKCFASPRNVNLPYFTFN